MAVISVKGLNLTWHELFVFTAPSLIRAEVLEMAFTTQSAQASAETAIGTSAQRLG